MNKPKAKYNEEKGKWEYTGGVDCESYGKVVLKDKAGNEAVGNWVCKPSYGEQQLCRYGQSNLPIAGNTLNWALVMMGYEEDYFFKFGDVVPPTRQWLYNKCCEFIAHYEDTPKSQVEEKHIFTPTVEDIGVLMEASTPTYKLKEEDLYVKKSSLTQYYQIQEGLFNGKT